MVQFTAPVTVSDAGEFLAREPELLRNLPEERIFARKETPVRHRDMKQPIHDVCQKMTVFVKQAIELPGIHFEAADVLLREVEDAGDVVLFAFGNFEDFG